MEDGGEWYIFELYCMVYILYVHVIRITLKIYSIVVVLLKFLFIIF